jgi:hypothetical protein
MADTREIDPLIDKIAHRLRKNPDFITELIQFIERETDSNANELASVDILKKQIIEKMEIEAKYIQNLTENWDEEGSKAFNQKTINLMKEVIITFIETLSNSLTFIPVPHISPLADGSIYIHFRNENLDLLINVTEETDSIYISADNCKKDEIKAILSKSIATDVLSGWVISLLSK